MNDDPATDILEATYRALCEHGYAALTLQDIADESGKSKASIHYHYDTKADLFSAFLEFLYERYTDRIDDARREDPRDHLRSLLDATLASDADAPDEAFQTAILEVKAQAPYDDAIQARLVAFDDYLFDRLRDVVAEGVESGAFGDAVDPETAADFLTTAIKGARTRRVAVDRPPERLHETITEYVETHLVADDYAEAARR